MKKIIIIMLTIILLSGCYSKNDAFNRVIYSNIELDALYEHPDSFVWVGIKGDKIYHIRGYADSKNIKVHIMKEVEMTPNVVYVNEQ